MLVYLMVFSRLIMNLVVNVSNSLEKKLIGCNYSSCILSKISFVSQKRLVAVSQLVLHEYDTIIIE